MSRRKLLLAKAVDIAAFLKVSIGCIILLYTLVPTVIAALGYLNIVGSVEAVDVVDEHLVGVAARQEPHLRCYLVIESEVEAVLALEAYRFFNALGIAVVKPKATAEILLKYSFVK